MSLRLHEEINYWKINESWYWIDEKRMPHIRDDAPEEAKKSFELWMAPGRP